METTTDLLASGAIVVFLVQQLKRVVPSGWLPLCSLLIGVLVQVVDAAVTGAAATPEGVWTAVLVGAGVGMAASGAYDLAQTPAPAAEAPTAAGEERDYGAEAVAVSESYSRDVLGHGPGHRTDDA